MKIQELAIIFIIIILPISIVLSAYTQYQIQTINTQTIYDTKLTSATFDAIKAFQLNTANSTLDDLSNSKIRDIEASVNTFKNSMIATFRLNGYSEDELNNYIPALVYTMYDGFYIYSPYENNNYMFDDTGDPILNNGETMYGLKPYISYSCRYIKGNIDVVITYTLDNYITIQGKIGTEYKNESGYLIDGITTTGDDVWYNGIRIDNENLTEYVIVPDGNLNPLPSLYQYIKYNGTKYYFDNVNERIFYYSNGNFTEYAKDNDSNKLFLQLYSRLNTSNRATITIQNFDGSTTSVEYPYVNDGGVTYYYDEKAYSFFYYNNGNKIEVRGNKAYNDMKNAITNNDAAKRYYKKAKEFTDNVRNDWGLGSLRFSDALELVENSDGTKSEVKLWPNDDRKIFEQYSTNIENKLSNFNQHRLEVIRHKIESNLSIAIANYNNYSGVVDIDFQMPELKEEEWDLVLNNISLISFVQGLDIGGKIYNGYTIVNNTESKEVVQEERIYILGEDNYYHKIGDTFLKNRNNIVISIPAGRLNLDFTRKSTNLEVANNKITKYHYPVKYDVYNSYKASYNSIVTQNGVETFADIYAYIETQKNSGNKELAEAFYTALGREREGMYKFATTSIK